MGCRIACPAFLAHMKIKLDQRNAWNVTQGNTRIWLARQHVWIALPVSTRMMVMVLFIVWIAIRVIFKTWLEQNHA